MASALKSLSGGCSSVESLLSSSIVNNQLPWHQPVGVACKHCSTWCVNFLLARDKARDVGGVFEGTERSRYVHCIV